MGTLTKEGVAVRGNPDRWVKAEHLAAAKTMKPAKVKARDKFGSGIDFSDVSDWRPPEYRSFVGRDRIGLDVEGHDPHLKTDGPGQRQEDAFLCGLGISYSQTDASYYPFAHEAREANMDPDKLFGQLREDAAGFEGEIVGANLQYDLDWLATRHGVQFPKAKFRDVQVAEPLLDENQRSYSLANIAERHGLSGKQGGHLDEIYGKNWIENFDKIHPAHASIYGMGDVTLPWELMDRQKQDITAQGLDRLFEMECDLTPLLLRMRKEGVRVDNERATDTYNELRAKQDELTKQIHEIGLYDSDQEVSIHAAATLAIGFENLGLAYTRTPKGAPSFTKDWLKAQSHEIANLIVEARSLDKTAGTFINSYILEGQIAGRIHCMFHQLKGEDGGTVTGRFSSSGPNLQNIPARDPILGPLMRSMFIPEEGMLWGSLDWSQIEYRLLIHYAATTPGIMDLQSVKDAVRMYKENPNTDFHQMAADITGVDRKAAKGINFGVVYGMGVDKMSRNLGVPVDEAKRVMGKFHDNAPFLREMLGHYSSEASDRGYIETIMGRRRRFNDWAFDSHARGENGRAAETEFWTGSLAGVRAFYLNWERRSKFRPPTRASTHKALNALLQGSAADLMKAAMVKMWDDGVFNVLIPHLTVHDELNSSVPDTKEGREAFEHQRQVMQDARGLLGQDMAIPILADGTLGSNWDEAK